MIQFSPSSPANVLSAWLNQVAIRRLEKTDLPALEWNGQYTHYRRIYASAYQQMLKGNAVLWVADMPTHGLIGQVFIQLNGERPELADGNIRAYLYAFRIQPAYRSCGLGSRMLNTVEEDLRQRDFHIITLNVAKNNPRARALYERHGYQVMAHEPGCWSYLDDKGQIRRMVEPAWRMEKHIHRGSPPTRD